MRGARRNPAFFNDGWVLRFRGPGDTAGAVGIRMV